MFAATALFACSKRTPPDQAPAPAVPRQAAAVADELEMIQKKTEVHRQVLENLVTSPTGMDGAAFEAAWARVPEAERRSLSVDQLAERIAPRPTQ